jgi:hypothetical protein
MDSWYNPLPGWIGWIALAVIIIGSAYMWYRFRKDKNRKSEFTHWTVRIQGFGEIYVPKLRLWDKQDMPEHPEQWPKSITQDGANVMACKLVDVWTELWLEMIKIYKHSPKGGWPVAYLKIENMVEEMPKAHKHVYWNAPHGSMGLLLADDMVYWFARECHNVFRCMMHGINHIYDTMDRDDLDKATQVEKWIADNYHE